MRPVDDPLDPQVFGRDCSQSRRETECVSVRDGGDWGAEGARLRTILEQVEPGFQGVARTDGLVASPSEEEDGTLDLLKHLVGREWSFEPEHELLQLEHVLAGSFCMSESQKVVDEISINAVPFLVRFTVGRESTHALLAIARESFAAGPGAALSERKNSRLPAEKNGGQERKPRASCPARCEGRDLPTMASAASGISPVPVPCPSLFEAQSGSHSAVKVFANSGGLATRKSSQQPA